MGCPPSTEILEIDADKLKRMQKLNVAFILLDVRSEERYSQGHIRGAINLPQQRFLCEFFRLVPAKDTPVIVYDEDGSLVPSLILQAERQGFSSLVGLEGGYEGFLKSV